MGWLARTINRLSTAGSKEIRRQQKIGYDRLGGGNERIMFDDNNPLISIDIMEANGGHIVRFYHYERVGGTYGDNEIRESFHIVTSTENLEECVSKMITYEMLKR